jgi:beta-hydroxyacyl-ACP dehydratase FabZ
LSVPIGRILEILPHRYPFLLLDRILEVEPGKRAVGLKNVTINEPFFPGHFPGNPVMPGVLIVEAMAQTGAMLLFHDREEELQGKYIYLAGVDGARFRRPVVPGDQLLLELEVLVLRRGTCRMQATARVDGKKVAEATLLSMLVDREEGTR